MSSRDRNAGKKAVAKRMVVAKKSAPARKAEPKKVAAPAKPVVAKAKVAAPAKKPVAAKPVPTAGKPQVLAKPAMPAKPVGVVAKPSVTPAAAPAAKPMATAKVAPSGANAAQQAEERRKAATRKFFARLRSLEAIVGADLRKRGSLVLMQAVDQWYSEAVSATATDITITNTAKAVIGHL